VNLAEMLSYADIADLTRIAGAYGCSGGAMHSKHELIQSILAAAAQREVIETQLGGMTADDMRFLNSLLFENRSAYSLEELTARAAALAGSQPSEGTAEADPARQAPPPASRAAAGKPGPRKRRSQQAQPPPEPESGARSAISRFRRNGWLFCGVTPQTRFLFQVPDDMKRRLCEALERRFRQSLEVREEPPVYRDERGLIEDDIRAFLRFVRDNFVPLTTDGTIYKRQLQQLLGQLAVAEAVPARSGWRFGYGRHFREYPERFSLIYDYCASVNWIVEYPDRLELSDLGREQADQGMPVGAADVYRFWLRLYKGPVSNLAALVHWTARLCRSSWATLSSVKRVLHPLAKPYYYDTVDDVLERRVFGMLVHLGVLRMGRTDAGETVIRTTPQGLAAVSGGQAPAWDEPRAEDFAPDRPGWNR